MNMLENFKNDLENKTVDELVVVKEELSKAIDGVSDDVLLCDSVIGQKFIERLNSDLDAVRKKYYHIKGNAEQQFAELNLLKGRECQLAQQLLSLTSAGKTKEDLLRKLEVILAFIEVKQKEGEFCR